MQKKKIYKLSSFALVFGIIVNFCAVPISNIIGGNASLYTMVGYVPLIIACSVSGAKINRNGKIVFLILFLSVVILILNLFFRNPDTFLIFKSIIYFVLFGVIFLFYKGNVSSLIITFLSLGFLFQINIFLNLSEILSSGLNLYNIRALTIVDKPFIAFAFSISAVTSLTFVVYKGFSLLHLINVMSILILNFFFLQTKVLFGIILIPFIIIFFSYNGIIYKRAKYTLIFSVIGLFLLFTSRPELVPDFMKNLVNLATSSQVYIVNDADTQDLTYIQRGKILDEAVGFIKDYPVLGYGPGNFANRNKSDVDLANETESTYLGIAVDYGVIFFTLHLTLLIYLLRYLFIKFRAFKDINNLYSLVLLLTTVLLGVFNDYFSFFYWVVLAVLFLPNVNINDEPCKNNHF